MSKTMADKMKNPDYYRTVMPYLIVADADAFLDFVQKVFPVEIKMSMRDDEGIRHAEIVIGDSTIMFGQSTPQWKPQTAGLFIMVASADESWRKAMDAGAEPVLELSDQEYGRTCGVRDPAGNIWWMTSERDWDISH